MIKGKEFFILIKTPVSLCISSSVGDGSEILEIVILCLYRIFVCTLYFFGLFKEFLVGLMFADFVQEELDRF